MYINLYKYQRLNSTMTPLSTSMPPKPTYLSLLTVTSDQEEVYELMNFYCFFLVFKYSK